MRRKKIVVTHILVSVCGCVGVVIPSVVHHSGISMFVFNTKYVYKDLLTYNICLYSYVTIRFNIYKYYLRMSFEYYNKFSRKLQNGEGEELGAISWKVGLVLELTNF